MAGRRRSKHKEEESNERWLLTYADMITLLMALFMVLFSISSVNISKVQALQKSLRAAFSGDILPGGKSIARPGATANASHAPTSADVQTIVPTTASLAGATQSSTASAAGSASAAQRQAELFAQIKSELQHYAAAHGFSNQVKAVVEARGLDIKVLTDDLLFPSGQATLDARSAPLLSEISDLLNVDQTHPIDVEGNTDDVPIQSSQFPSNWELSTARASTVVRFLIGHGVSPARLTATGNADQRPQASNETAAGRAQNRRVEIVLKALTPSETNP